MPDGLGPVLVSEAWIPGGGPLSVRVRIEPKVTTSLELPLLVDLGQGDEVDMPCREP